MDGEVGSEEFRGEMDEKENARGNCIHTWNTLNYGASQFQQPIVNVNSCRDDDEQESGKQGE